MPSGRLLQVVAQEGVRRCTERSVPAAVVRSWDAVSENEQGGGRNAARGTSTAEITPGNKKAADRAADDVLVNDDSRDSALLRFARAVGQCDEAPRALPLAKE